MSDFRIGTVEDVVMAMQRARGQAKDPHWGGVLMFTGAGCSQSAGIPTAVEIAKTETTQLASRYSNNETSWADADAALAWLKSKKKFPADLDWPAAYGHLFDRHFVDSTEQQAAIQRAVEQAKGLNWAHVCIAELVRHRCVHTLLTTNFDQLALESFVRASLTPVVADGVEAFQLVSARPTRPQLVHIHGSRHAYRPRNSTTDVAAVEAIRSAGNAVGALLRESRGLVVLGYSGQEEGIMRLLQTGVQDWPGKAVYWIAYDANPDNLSPAAKAFLRTARGTLVPGQDADAFMSALIRGLGIGVPSWIRSPLDALREQLNCVVCPPDDSSISELLDTHKAQLEALDEAFVEHLARRTELAKALVEFTDLECAGKPREAVDTLAPFKEELTPRQQKLLAAQALAAGAIVDDREMPYLKLAADLYRQASAHETPDTRDWALSLRSYGNAVVALAQRDRLVEANPAVAAYEQALTVFSKESAPSEWAKTQNNLGIALGIVATRDGTTEKLEQSAAAFRAAMTVHSQADDPLEWARLQNNLAHTLRILGARGTPARTQEAIDAFREAAAVRTRERSPDEWGLIQFNLAGALMDLARRTQDLLPAREAVTALQGALQTRPPDKSPIRWATTQHALAMALVFVGDHGHEAAALEEAVTAFRAAIAVYTPAAYPMESARIQAEIGNALGLIAGSGQSVRAFTEAVDVLKRAIATFKQLNAAADAANCQNNLARVYFRFGTGTEDRSFLADAIAHYEELLRDPAADDWIKAEATAGIVDAKKKLVELAPGSSAQGLTSLS